MRKFRLFVLLLGVLSISEQPSKASYQLRSDGWVDQKTAEGKAVQDFKAEKVFHFYDVQEPSTAIFTVKSSGNDFADYDVFGAEHIYSYEKGTRLVTRYEWYAVSLEANVETDVSFVRHLKAVEDGPDEWASITVSGPTPFYINANPPVAEDLKLTEGFYLPVNDNDSDADEITDLEDEEVYGRDPDLRRMTIEHPWRFPVTVSVDKAGLIRLYETQNKRFGNKLTNLSLAYNGTDDKKFWIEGAAPGVVAMTVTAPGGLSDSIKINIPGISFLDAQKNPVSKLYVGKWEGCFQTASPRTDFIQYDKDRFYVQVVDKDKKGDGTLSVALSTDSPDDQYDDAATTVTLTETFAGSGIFLSETQLLVSDDTDDDYDYFDINVPDEQENDRTHKISLGGTVKAKYKEGIECKAEVPLLLCA